MTREQEQFYINKVLDGDRSAFEHLVLDNQDNVYNLAMKILRNEQDALDAAQEVFLKAYTHLASFRGDSRFSVWLYRLTYNECLDISRSKSRRPTVSMTGDGDEDEAGDMDFPSNLPGPQEIMENRELRLALAKAVNELPDEQKQVFILRHFNDMDYAAIAAELNLNVGTVKSRLNRARKKVADELIENGTITPAYRQNSGKGVRR